MNVTIKCLLNDGNMKLLQWWHVIHSPILQELTLGYTPGSESDRSHVLLLLLSPQLGWGGLRIGKTNHTMGPACHESNHDILVHVQRPSIMGLLHYPSTT